jgi:hypothetical protein
MPKFRVLYNLLGYRDVEAINEKEARAAASIDTLRDELKGNGDVICSVGIEHATLLDKA